MGKMNDRPIEDRIMERVCKLPASDGGCWLWTGALSAAGYGQIRYRGKVEYVHRLMAKHYGLNVDGETVDHLCFNRACVRGSHLTICSREENARRENSAAWRRVVAELIAQQSAEADQ